MTTARFCSECGERLKVRRRAVLPLRAFCDRCSPRFRTVRLVSAAALTLVIIALVVSRPDAQHEPFYFIGTPLDSIANSASSAAQGPVESARSIDQPLTTENLVVGICGAPTRSGKPCQRKVKGGGYCWQHRDKAAAKDAMRSK